MPADGRSASTNEVAEARRRGEQAEQRVQDSPDRLDSQDSPEQRTKDTIAADIAEAYGVIIPLHIRVGATQGQLRDIKGLLHDANQRYEDFRKKEPLAPITGFERPQGGTPSLITYHEPRVPLA